MQLNPVSLEQLSALEHEVRLPNHPKFHIPEFKVIAYVGTYRFGAQGKNDALYIMATAEAAHKAWYTESIVIDFSRLQYDWGDEMQWVLDIGQDATATCHYPLAIIVGPGCEPALKTLIPDEYDDHCVASLEDAVTLLVEKRRSYEECLAAWRAKPLIRTDGSD
jgi:hypothetical protein